MPHNSDHRKTALLARPVGDVGIADMPENNYKHVDLFLGIPIEAPPLRDRTP